MAFHRENKNRPRELSAKKPVSVFRDVFGVKKKHHRDPRFDDLSGSFDSQQFEEDYAFVEDIKKKEKEELKKELGKVGENTQRKQEIMYLLQRMSNQERNKKQLKKRKVEEQALQEGVMDAAKSGIKPYIPKKSELKRQRLVESFEALKKSGKLDKYLERKRKKQFSRDRSRFYQ